MITAHVFRYALGTNSTSTAFTQQNATTTEPSGAGIFDLHSRGLGVGMNERSPTYLQLIPFGTAADNNTFDMRLYGYSATLPTTGLVSEAAIYIPQLLIDISVVMSAVTFSDWAASTFLVDAITVNKGAADNADWRSVISPANNSVASLIVNTRGCRYIKFDWDLAGASEAASMNCLWRPIEIGG